MVKRIYLVKDSRSELVTEQVTYDEYKGFTVAKRNKGDRYIKHIKLYDPVIKKYRKQTVDVEVMEVTPKTVMIGVI